MVFFWTIETYASGKTMEYLETLAEGIDAEAQNHTVKIAWA